MMILIIGPVSAGSDSPEPGVPYPFFGARGAVDTAVTEHHLDGRAGPGGGQRLFRAFLGPGHMQGSSIRACEHVGLPIYASFSRATSPRAEHCSGCTVRDGTTLNDPPRD